MGYPTKVQQITRKKLVQPKVCKTIICHGSPIRFMLQPFSPSALSV
jgi:hypothetical protein